MDGISADQKEIVWNLKKQKSFLKKSGVLDFYGRPWQVEQGYLNYLWMIYMRLWRNIKMKNKKMKNLRKKLSYVLYALLGAFLLTSCNGSNDESKCLQSVKEKFPNSKIYTKYDGGFTFVVVDSVNVYLVKTLSLSSPKVTNVYVLENK